MRSSSSTRGRCGSIQPTRKAFGILLLATAAACTGSIAGEGSGSHDGRGATGGTAAGGVDAGAGAGAGGASIGTAEERTYRSPGIRRLGRHELSNTFEDLLGADVDMSALPEDPTVERLSNNANSAKVGYGDLETYLRIAEDAASKVLPKFLAWLGCDLATVNDACVAKGLPRFLRSAWRRPATADEVKELLTTYAELSKDAAAATALPELLEAIILSPNFLYRTERGTGVMADGHVQLTGYETASRMSYLVWQSLPDEALLDAAESGRLGTGKGRVNELQRMFISGKGRVGTEGFVLEWIGAKNVTLDRKHQSVLAGLPNTLLTSMRKEVSSYISHVLFDSKGTVEELLTATYGYPDAALADIYAVDPKLANGSQLALPTTQRRGLITQPLVLSAHTKEIGESPIQLGKFIREHVLCQPVPPPPPTVNATLPDDPTLALLPLRQRFEKHASDGVCVSCHKIFDPPGFALLNYDPIGRFRPKDGAGRAYDTAGVLTELDGQEVAFTTPTEMIDVVGKSAAARDCFATQLYRWNLGHLESGDEEGSLAAFLKDFAAADGDMRAGLSRLLEDDSFVRVRATPDGSVGQQESP